MFDQWEQLFLEFVLFDNFLYILVHRCDNVVKIIDRLPGDHKAIDWNQWDAKIKRKSSTWKSFPKGHMPATQEMKFEKAVYDLVEILGEKKNFHRYLSLLAFLKEHPMINIILLKFAAVGLDLQGEFTSRILVSPFEVKSEILALIQSILAGYQTLFFPKKSCQKIC